jgi:hypothetical protein
MALTGLPDQPLGPPDGLLEALDHLARPFKGLVDDLDPVALLAERAALMGLWRRGTTSCGGSCRLFPSAGGFVAVSLPRAEDMEAVPAWLELDDVPRTAPATWRAVEHNLARRDPDELVARAVLLGLAVGGVGEAAGRPDLIRTALGEGPARELSGLRVVDLSALWAGPLCGDLLAAAGATVVKVESRARPDGARRGPQAFFDLLNGRKRSVSLDFSSPGGLRALHRLVQRADVVIEASRPRALEQLGLRAGAMVREGGPQVWISITGHGRAGSSAGRIGFGDDTAAAGGLVAWHEGRPLFCADAVADPLAGLTAAHACVAALSTGGRWLLDVSLAGVSARHAGPTLPTPAGLVADPPRARRPARRAPELGADTAQVLAELGIEA